MANNCVINEDGRECSGCHEFKQWSEFNKNKTTKTGHQSICRCCAAIRQKPHTARWQKTLPTDPYLNNVAQMFCLGVTSERNRS